MMAERRSSEMSERHEFVEKMQRAMDELQVKANLTKLELRDVKDDVKNELIHEYDKLHDKLRDLRTENADEWSAVKGGFLSAWDSFKDRFHKVTKA
jgi:hypothetical protein